MPAEPILWFFEIPKQSGGGPVLELNYNEQEASAVVTFENRDGYCHFCLFHFH